MSKIHRIGSALDYIAQLDIPLGLMWLGRSGIQPGAIDPQ